MNKKDKIRDFLTEIKKENFIPEFCYNGKETPNKVYYSE